MNASRALVAVAFVAISLCLPASAMAVVPGGNLLQNSGAEQRSTPPPGWLANGSFGILTYGTDAYPSNAVSVEIQGGCAFFTGAQEPVAQGTQVIDLSNIPEVGSAGVTATLSGYLGGFSTQEDNAIVDVTYRDGGTPVGSPLRIGPVTSADRDGHTTLLRRLTSGQVPAAADTAEVTITLTRAAGVYNDGYADNLTYSLDGSTPVPPSGICPTDSDGDGSTDSQDCADTNPSIHPGAPEILDNGVDEDCDGADRKNMDRDGDGSPRPADCNDANRLVHPGAVDVPGNRIDEDCRGGPAPFPLLDSTITNTYDYRRTFTVFTELRIRRVHAGDTLRMRCIGRGARSPRAVENSRATGAF